MSDKSQIHLTEQLHRAIHAGLLQEVRKLIKDGAKMDHVLGMRGTALCAAIEARNLEIVKYLLELGCDVNARDFDGEPPILLALRKDSPGHLSGRVPCLDIVQAIVEHEKCNVNKYDPLTKKAAIHFAVEQRMTEAVRWLVHRTGAIKCKLNTADLIGNTPLHLAVHEGVSPSVQVLVDHPDCLIKVYNKAGLTPLHICANTGDVKSLTILLKRLGSTGNKLEFDGDHESELVLNVNAVTVFENETPLHLAVRNGHRDVLSILLENGANVNYKNYLNNTPLMLSMVSLKQWQSMDNIIPKCLLNRGANPNVLSEVRCRYFKSHLKVTPLIIAIYNDNLDMVKCLIENGADVNMVDNVENTPLNVAVSEGQQKIASWLLTECKGINVNAQNIEGETSLHACLKCFKQNDSENSINFVRQLIQAGAEILPDNQGQTVITRAIEYENQVVLDAIFQETGLSAQQYIVSNDASCIPGVSFLSEGVYMSSFIHVAVAEGLLDIVKVLLSHGADIDDTTNTGQSTLYIALTYKHFHVARYLVEQGCSLVNESYIFIDTEKPCKPVRNQAIQPDDSGSDSTDESDYDLDDSDNDDVFSGNQKLKLWIRTVALTPRTLKLQSVITIRKYFVENQIVLSKVDSLKLPEMLKARIRYRD